MSEEISFGEGDKKITPEFHDIDEKEMRDKAIKGIEQQQIKQEELSNAGMQPLPTDVQSLPKEVPYLFFHFGAKAIDCPKFETDDAENTLIAKHLSILIGAQNSKIWSLIVILLVIFGKVVQCKEAIGKKFGRGKEKIHDETNGATPA